MAGYQFVGYLHLKKAATPEARVRESIPLSVPTDNTTPKASRVRGVVGVSVFPDVQIIVT